MAQGASRKSYNSGFTIVELLIVIVVIAILAAITIVAYNGINQQARDSKRTSDVRTLVQAIEMYNIDHGSYPSVGSDNAGYSSTTLQSVLVPDYISSIPKPPTPSDTSDYNYVRGSGGVSFDIRVNYETKPRCHSGQNNAGVAWWSLPAC